MHFLAKERNLQKWFLPPSAGVHFDVADGLRGVAILWVVLCHAVYARPDGPKLFMVVARICEMGWLGVPIFFALSAFLLSLPFFRGRAQVRDFSYVRGYATRRLCKIIPPFYLSIAVLFVLNYWHSGDPEFITLALASASGVTHFVRFQHELNPAYWSLWVEVGFYAVLPLCFFATRKLSLRTTAWLMFAGLVLVPLSGRWFFWPGPANMASWILISARFPNYLDGFAWGSIFAAYYQLWSSSKPEPVRGLAAFGYAGILALAVSALVLRNEYVGGKVPGRSDVELIHWLPEISSFLLLFFVLDPGCLGSRFFSMPILRFLGMVSYEWFLCHIPILHFFRALPIGRGSFWHWILAVPTPMLLSLGLSAVVYYKFSLPIMRWGRNKVGRGASAGAQDTPTTPIRPGAPETP